MPRTTPRQSILLAAGLLLIAAGCNSPYRSDQGALFGGLAGAGLGAVVGNAVGNPVAGAALGAGVGAMSGAAVGGSLDEIEARNRAEIAATMGRPVAVGAVTNEDVVAMTQAGVNEELIVTHVRSHGIARPLSAGDLIVLQQQGVSARVIGAMQQPPMAGPVMAGPPMMPVAGPPMIVEGPPVYYAPAPVYGPPVYRAGPPRAAMSYGVSVSR